MGGYLFPQPLQSDYFTLLPNLQRSNPILNYVEFFLINSVQNFK